MISPEDKQNYQSMTQNELNEGFILACRAGDLDIVKYLLTCSDLKEHADIHAQDDEGFREACWSGHLEVVKYLLTSQDLAEHADIHAQQDSGFLNACYNKNFHILDYLVIEYNMNISKELKHNLITSDTEGHKHALQLIEARDLAGKINGELEEKSFNKHKVKL